MNFPRITQLLLIVTCLFFMACSSDPTTCQICGYKSVDDGTCQLCTNEQWDESMEQSKEEYLKEKQMNWFIPTGDKVDFYGPYKVQKVEGGYYFKDTTNWKPVINASDVEMDEELSVDDILGGDPFADDSTSTESNVDTTAADTMAQ